MAKLLVPDVSFPFPGVMKKGGPTWFDSGSWLRPRGELGKSTCNLKVERGLLALAEEALAWETGRSQG